MFFVTKREYKALTLRVAKLERLSGGAKTTSPTSTKKEKRDKETVEDRILALMSDGIYYSIPTIYTLLRRTSVNGEKINRRTVNTQLSKMYCSGRVMRVARGLYQIKK